MQKFLYSAIRELYTWAPAVMAWFAVALLHPTLKKMMESNDRLIKIMKEQNGIEEKNG